MTTPLQHYFAMKAMHQNTTSILKGGVWYRIVDGEQITEEDFRQRYHIPESPYGARVNPDGTKILRS